MSFDTGQQPCKGFAGEPGYFGIQEHECYCKGADGAYCKGTVSFCRNCSTDHHKDGYEKCVRGGRNGRVKKSTKV